MRYILIFLANLSLFQIQFIGWPLLVELPQVSQGDFELPDILYSIDLSRAISSGLRFFDHSVIEAGTFRCRNA